MMDTMMDFFICVFEVYVFYDFLHDILEKRTENKMCIMTVLGILLATLFGVNQLQISQLNLIAVPVLFLLGTVFLFCGNLKARIFYYLIFYVIMTGMECVVCFLYAILFPLEISVIELFPFRNLILAILLKLLSYVALRMIKLFLAKREVGMKGRLLKMTFLFPLTTMLLYAGLYYANIQIEEGKWLLCMGVLLLLFSNILVFYIIEKLAFVMEENSEYELMDLQNTLNHAYYEKMEEVEEKQKQYAHNLKEYLQTINGLAVKNRSEEIVDILKEMEVEIDSIADKIYTEHHILNALLCQKAEQAHKENIQFQIMIEPGLYLENIKNGDLIVMVGNLIDNALEAAALCKGQKKIDLKFFESDGNFIVLDIENTYGNKVRKNKDTYLSTKKDAGCHGIGIKSVREIAEKYGGLLFMEQRDDVFVSILTLSKLDRNG